MRTVSMSLFAAGNVKELATRESAIKFANEMVDLETIEIVRASESPFTYSVFASVSIT